MVSDTSETKDTHEVRDAQRETSPDANKLNPTGQRAMQGRTEATDQREADHMKGSEFEAWAKDHVFHGEGRRLSVHAEDNPHLEKSGDGYGISKSRRQSDSFITNRGDVFELKSGYEQGGIDKDQVRDYALMRDAGRVYEHEDGEKASKPTPTRDVYYVFDSKAGAEANRSVLEDQSFFVLYRDDKGILQQLK